MGDGGQVLQWWAISSEGDVNDKFLTENVGKLGAIICGRTTYDTSVPWWGANGPSGAARRPVYVVTHKPPKDSPEGGVYSFVTEGLEAALAKAQASAGAKEVSVMGGANIGQQYLKAGLLDEIAVSVVPVLLGEGTRLFDRLGKEVRKLEVIQVLDTPTVTHLRYRVVK